MKDPVNIDKISLKIDYVNAYNSADCHVNISLKQARRTAEVASNFKHKYSELKTNNYIFNAFAVEILGCWSIEALQLVNKIGPMLTK